MGLSNEEIGRTFIRTLNSMGYTAGTKSIEDRLASVGLSPEEVINHYQQKEEYNPNYDELNETLTKLFSDMSKAKAQAIKEEEENQKYYKPFLSEVGKKLKSFEEE